MDTILDEPNYNSMVAKYGIANTLNHILRTPITCILGFSNILSSTNLTSKQKKYVQNIEQSTHQLLSTIEFLLGNNRDMIKELRYDHKK